MDVLINHSYNPILRSSTCQTISFILVKVSETGIVSFVEVGSLSAYNLRVMFFNKKTGFLRIYSRTY